MLYEIRYFASKIRTVVVSEGCLDETLLTFEGYGIKVLSVKERLIRRVTA